MVRQFGTKWGPDLTEVRAHLVDQFVAGPQVFITAVFFFWPAGQAVYQSLFIPDPFGLKTQFVGLGNFEFLLGDPFYRASFWTTTIFSTCVTVTTPAAAEPTGRQTNSAAFITVYPEAAFRRS